MGAHEPALARARAEQAAPGWQADYRATPTQSRTQARAPDAPKARRDRARVRGKAKVDADFRLLAAPTNLERLAVLELVHGHRMDRHDRMKTTGGQP